METTRESTETLRSLLAQLRRDIAKLGVGVDARPISAETLVGLVEELVERREAETTIVPEPEFVDPAVHAAAMDRADRLGRERDDLEVRLSETLRRAERFEEACKDFERQAVTARETADKAITEANLARGDAAAARQVTEQVSADRDAKVALATEEAQVADRRVGELADECEALRCRADSAETAARNAGYDNARLRRELADLPDDDTQAKAEADELRSLLVAEQAAHEAAEARAHHYAERREALRSAIVKVLAEDAR